MTAKSRKRVVGCAVLASAMLIALGYMAHKRSSIPVDDARSQADAKAFIGKVTDNMDICDNRSPFMDNPMRSGDAVRAYEDAKSAHDVCRKMASLIKSEDIPETLPGPEAERFTKMRDDCWEAYGERALAFSDLSEALDSNGQISKVSAYRESAQRTAGEIAACKEQIRQASVPLGI